MESSNGYTYQLNAYFGIHYDHSLIETVLNVAKRDPRFAGLNGDDAEARVGKFHLFASTNSDKDNSATRGLIFVDEMTFGGPDVDDPEDGFIIIEPAEMEKREKKCEQAVNAVTDLYDLVIRDFKAKRLPLGKVHLGWMTLACTWDLELDDESNEKSSVSSTRSSSEPRKKKDTAKAPTQKAR